MKCAPPHRGLSPLEVVCALGVLSFLVLIAAAPAHRTLTKARVQAQTIRHWDARQAALAEAVALDSSPALWPAGSAATSAK